MWLLCFDREENLIAQTKQLWAIWTSTLILFNYLM